MPKTTYEIRWNYGHYDLYCNGHFVCSADTYEEALADIDELEVA